MKICGRCDQTIQDGEPYTEYPMDSPSAGGATVYRHVVLCKKVPTQTSQVRVRH